MVSLDFEPKTQKSSPDTIAPADGKNTNGTD